MNKLENKNRQNRVPLSPQMKTKNQRSSELDADFLFSFATPRRRRGRDVGQRPKSRRERDSCNAVIFKSFSRAPLPRGERQGKRHAQRG